MKWKTLDTAPRDGRQILACTGDYTLKEYLGLHPWRGPITVYWGQYHPNSPGKKAWRDGSGHLRPGLTHWMPLPEPPQ